MEISYNQKLVGLVMPSLEQLLNSQASIEPSRVMTNPVFPNRFRLNAAAQYLQRPFFIEAVPAEQVEAYWETLILCNAMLDRCIGLTTVGVVTGNVKQVVEKAPAIIRIGDGLAAKITDVLRTLGPLAAT